MEYVPGPTLLGAKIHLQKKGLTRFGYARYSRVLFDFNLVEERINAFAKDGEVIRRATLNLLVA